MGNRETKIIKVIRIVTEIGDGSQNNPYRDGIEFWDEEGNLLFITEANEKMAVTFEARREP